MTDKDRDKRLEKAQLKILFHLPFFAAGVMKLPVEFTDDPAIKTACTNGARIMWDRGVFDKLPDECLPTILCHEVEHCLRGHMWRIPGGSKSGDWDVWNQATDHAVNLSLEEFGRSVSSKGLADPFPFPKDVPVLKDRAFDNLSEEEIYSRISNNSAGKGKSSGAGGVGQIQAPPDSPGQPGQASQSQKLKTDWQATLIQSVEMAKKRGDVPGYAKRLIDELVNPRVPWPELLRAFLREQVNDDWNWMRPNPYFDGGDFILPSLDSERMSSVVFAVDTSGSIDIELLKQFKSEMQACLDDLKPSKLVELCCDTRITSEREYRAGDSIKGDAPGGGGTAFGPVFERCEDLNPKCVVYLTDLQGSFPKVVPGYPVIWLAYNNGDTKAPFGETVNVER